MSWLCDHQRQRNEAADARTRYWMVLILGAFLWGIVVSLVDGLAGLRTASWGTIGVLMAAAAAQHVRERSRTRQETAKQ
jgi:hypothetical protein